MNSAPGARSASLARLRWQGRDVFYRPGTSDPLVLYQILLRRGKKAEYYLPPALQPKLILDIGSNIGASILYFQHQFPDAKIFGFEPHPETFSILRLNVAEMPSVFVFNYALGAKDMTVTVPSNGINFSAFSPQRRFRNLLDPTATVDCQVRHAGVALKELGVTRAELIKIDCEGGELEIFTALPDEMLSECKWIVGEMHDVSGFRALALLASHFNLDLKKKMFNPLFRFHACNLANIAELQGTFGDKALQM
jgi:FkbM family methyltransferase